MLFHQGTKCQNETLIRKVVKKTLTRIMNKIMRKRKHIHYEALEYGIIPLNIKHKSLCTP